MAESEIVVRPLGLVAALVAVALLGGAPAARAQTAPGYAPYAAFAPPRSPPGLLEDLSRGTLLIHGNYCGPGNRAPLPPIDPVDAACARHDACTPTGAPPSCACNARLRAETAFLSRSPYLRDDLRALAGTISFAAALLPCAPR